MGPRTMAMLLGVILFTSCSSASRARNFIRYLGRQKVGLARDGANCPRTPQMLLRPQNSSAWGFQREAKVPLRMA